MQTVEEICFIQVIARDMDFWLFLLAAALILTFYLIFVFMGQFDDIFRAPLESKRVEKNSELAHFSVYF